MVQETFLFPLRSWRGVGIQHDLRLDHHFRS